MINCIPFYKKKKTKEKWNILKYKYSFINNKNVTNKKKLNAEIKYTNIKFFNEKCNKLFNRILNIKEIKNIINNFLYKTLDKIKIEFKNDLKLFKDLLDKNLPEQLNVVSLMSKTPICGIYYFDNNNRLNWFTHTGYIFNNLILKSKYTLYEKLLFSSSFNYHSFFKKNIHKVYFKDNFFSKVFYIECSSFYGIYDYFQNIFSCVIDSGNIDYTKLFFNKYYKYINCQIFCICLSKTIKKNNFEIFEFLMNNLILYAYSDEIDFNILYFRKSVTIILFNLLNLKDKINYFENDNYKFIDLYLKKIREIDLLNDINYYCNKIVINNKEFYTMNVGRYSIKTNILIECISFNDNPINILKIFNKYLNLTNALIKYNHQDLGNAFIMCIENHDLTCIKFFYNLCPDIINHKYEGISPLHILSFYTNVCVEDKDKEKKKKINDMLIFFFNCPNLNINSEDPIGRTPFMLSHPDYYKFFKIKDKNIFERIDKNGNNILMGLFYEHNNEAYSYYRIENNEFYKFKKILHRTKNLLILNKEKKDLFQLMLELKSSIYIKKKIFNEYYKELFKRNMEESSINIS